MIPTFDFMTTEEVLRHLRVTPRTTYRLSKPRDIPAMRVGPMAIPSIGSGRMAADPIGRPAFHVGLE